MVSVFTLLNCAPGTTAREELAANDSIAHHQHHRRMALPFFHLHRATKSMTNITPQNQVSRSTNTENFLSERPNPKTKRQSLQTPKSSTAGGPSMAGQPSGVDPIPPPTTPLGGHPSNTLRD